MRGIEIMNIRNFVEKNKQLKKLAKSTISVVHSVLLKISPRISTKFKYRIITGKKLDLKNPKDFNEKIQWLKLYKYNNDELVVRCADKYRVRGYIDELGIPEIKNKLLGSYDEPSQIDWDNLPNKFVIKANHGCGYNIICDDKNKCNFEEIKAILRKWLNEDYGKKTGELHYSKIRKKIIIENFIETKEGALPTDYKFYCFNGIPKLILVISDRNKSCKSDYKRDFLDLQWNRLDIGPSKYNKGPLPKKPKNLQKMIDYSKILSKDFIFVRVDFYDTENGPIFGELTFTPAGGMATYFNDKELEMLGEMLELPIEKEIK